MFQLPAVIQGHYSAWVSEERFQKARFSAFGGKTPFCLRQMESTSCANNKRVGTLPYSSKPRCYFKDFTTASPAEENPLLREKISKAEGMKQGSGVCWGWQCHVIIFGRRSDGSPTAGWEPRWSPRVAAPRWGDVAIPPLSMVPPCRGGCPALPDEHLGAGCQAAPSLLAFKSYREGQDWCHHLEAPRLPEFP